MIYLTFSPETYRWPVYVCWGVIIALISILLETATDTCNAQREASLSVNELHLTLWPTKVQNPPEGIKVISFYSLFSLLFPRTEHSFRSLLKLVLYDWSSSICLKYYYCQSLLISLCKTNVSIKCIRCSCVFHAHAHLFENAWFLLNGRYLYSHILYFCIFSWLFTLRSTNLRGVLLFMWHHYHIALELSLISVQMFNETGT